jgi:hypothetical protein
MAYIQQDKGGEIVNKITEIFFWGLFSIMWCRANSCHFPESKSQKYIVIKNTVIARILISGVVGRQLVNSSERNKMSVVGLISYIVILPTYLFFIAINVMKLFNYRGLDNDFMNSLYIIDLCILVGLNILNILILVIRQELWYIRRRRSQ